MRTSTDNLSLPHYLHLCGRLRIAYHRTLRRRGIPAAYRLITKFSRVMTPRLQAAGLIRGRDARRFFTN